MMREPFHRPTAIRRSLVLIFTMLFLAMLVIAGSAVHASWKDTTSALFLAAFLITTAFFALFSDSLIRRIQYLSLHDPMTGLCSRAFLEAECRRVGTSRSLPLSVIVGDISGLRLTNDVFGHAAGDLLIRKAAATLKQTARTADIIARTSGDGFVLVLPRTGRPAAEERMRQIREKFAAESGLPIPGSMSLGCATLSADGQNLNDVIEAADDAMLQDKKDSRRQDGERTLQFLVGAFHRDSPEEQSHARRVAALCERTAQALDLPEESIRQAERAGYLHDIGKITLKPLAGGNGSASPDKDTPPHDVPGLTRHPAIGSRLLRAIESTAELAEAVHGHHEAWDGSGYPRGLAGEAIPLLARIIAVAQTYDLLVHDGHSQRTPAEAAAMIRSLAGRRFDPVVAAAFLSII